MAKIIDVEGIGPSYAEKLQSAGINTTDELLEHCKSSKGRKDMAESTGISEKLVLRWTNHADLFRVKGIGEEYADLLEAAGVDTVPELDERGERGEEVDPAAALGEAGRRLDRAGEVFAASHRVLARGSVPAGSSAAGQRRRCACIDCGKK
jgi:predicted flap endonuclease-1-like 5' DNA nuclease